MFQLRTFLAFLARMPWLPAWTLAVLLLIAVILEALVHHTALWPSKLPLLILLALLWARRRRDCTS